MFVTDYSSVVNQNFVALFLSLSPSGLLLLRIFFLRLFWHVSTKDRVGGWVGGGQWVNPAGKEGSTGELL